MSEEPSLSYSERLAPIKRGLQGMRSSFLPQDGTGDKHGKKMFGLVHAVFIVFVAGLFVLGEFPTPACSGGSWTNSQGLQKHQSIP